MTIIGIQAAGIAAAFTPLHACYQRLFMDKMTDAKIRLWLKNNNPALLENYTRYQTESFADFSLPDDGASAGPESLRTWLEKRHPDILAQIPLW